MHDARFYALSWDSPLRFLERKLLPLRCSQLSRAHENERGKSQRAAHDEGALITVDGPQERTYLLRLCYRGVVLVPRRRQGTAQIPARITNGTSCALHAR